MHANGHPLTDDLQRPYADLATQRAGLLAALEEIDLHCRELRRRITAEGEAAKRERRPANKALVDTWKATWDRLGDDRIALKHRLGELKAEIKLRNVLSNGYVQPMYSQEVAQAFLEVARARLDADTFAVWLAEAQARVKEHSSVDTP